MRTLNELQMETEKLMLRLGTIKVYQYNFNKEEEMIFKRLLEMEEENKQIQNAMALKSEALEAAKAELASAPGMDSPSKTPYAV